MGEFCYPLDIDTVSNQLTQKCDGTRTIQNGRDSSLTAPMALFYVPPKTPYYPVYWLDKVDQKCAKHSLTCKVSSSHTPGEIQIRSKGW